MSNQKIYKGSIDEHGNRVVTVNGKPLRHVVYHSPSGFSWGYLGSGCAELALSILANYFNETWVDHDYLMKLKLTQQAPKCWRYHQEFKRFFVARWGMDDSWELSSETIEAWVAPNEHDWT